MHPEFTVSPLLAASRTPLQSYNSRNLQRVCHDSRVACLTTDIRRKALCVFIQLRCVGRCQIMCDNNGILVDCTQIRNRQSQQITFQTECNILNISCSLFKYSLSMDSNMATIIFATSLVANSAFTLSFSIIEIIWLASSGSPAIIR